MYHIFELCVHVYITDIAAGVLTSHIGSDVRLTITWVHRTGTIIILVSNCDIGAVQEV